MAGIRFCRRHRLLAGPPFGGLRATLGDHCRRRSNTSPTLAAEYPPVDLVAARRRRRLGNCIPFVDTRSGTRGCRPLHPGGLADGLPGGAGSARSLGTADGPHPRVAAVLALVHRTNPRPRLALAGSSPRRALPQSRGAGRVRRAASCLGVPVAALSARFGPGRPAHSVSISSRRLRARSRIDLAGTRSPQTSPARRPRAVGIGRMPDPWQRKGVELRRADSSMGPLDRQPVMARPGHRLVHGDASAAAICPQRSPPVVGRARSAGCAVGGARPYGLSARPR